MKKYHFLTLIGIVSCFLSSCSTIKYSNGHYASSEAGVLEISEKDDIKVAGSLGISDIGSGFNVQAGYSPIKHLAIASSFIRLSHSGLNEDRNSLDTDNNLIDTKFNLLEGSVGTYYFLPFKKQSDNIGVLFDLYGGVGIGKVKNGYGNNAASNLNYNHYYLQGGIHLKMKWFGFSYLLRQTRLDYTKGNIDYVSWSSGYFQDLNDLTSAPFNVNGNFLRMSFYLKPFQLYFTFSKLSRNGDRNNFIGPFGSFSSFQYSTFPLETINIGVTTEINDLLDFIKKNKKRRETPYR